MTKTKPNPRRCPICRRDGVDLSMKKCTACGKSPFLRNIDTPPADAPFFMWLNAGPMGTGWYRRDGIIKLFGGAEEKLFR